MDKIEFEIIKHYVSPEISKEYVMILSRDKQYYIIEHGNINKIIKSKCCKSLFIAKQIALKWVGDRI